MADEATDQQEWKNAETRVSEQADPVASFEGRALISIETSEDRPLAFDWLVVDDFAAFLRFIRPLSPREKDILLSYYVLGCGQRQIAHMLGLVQQSNIAQIIQGAKERRAGIRTTKTLRVKHEVIVRKDPDHLGNFRLTLAQSRDVLSERSGVRRGNASSEYGDER